MKKAIILITTVSIITACNTDIIEVKHSDSSNYWQPQKKYISLDEAEQNLQKIIMDIKLNNTRASQNHDFNITSRYSTGMATTRSGCDSIPEIYVFNFGKNDGYAIMSSDIREPDLYALSLEGRLNPDSITDETDTRIFLTILKNHLKFIYGNQTDTTNNTITNNTKKNTNSVIVRYSPWETTNKIYKDGSIELCKVKWTQGYPYNGMMPIYNGNHVPTGCAATAVGQFMSVYKHPTTYSPLNFDWNTIDSYIKMDDNTPWSPLYQVQGLMLYLAMYNNLDLNYDPSSNNNTCNDFNNVIRTLTNFGYSNHGTMSEYNTNTVVNELENGYPVLICGADSMWQSGGFLGIGKKTHYSSHMWLAHGLQIKSRKKTIWNPKNHELLQTIIEKQYYILCNMGYGGNYMDKYYLSGVFDARDSLLISMNTNYDNYRYNIRTITGVRK